MTVCFFTSGLSVEDSEYYYCLFFWGGWGGGGVKRYVAGLMKVIKVSFIYIKKIEGGGWSLKQYIS